MREPYHGRLDFSPSMCRPCTPTPVCKASVHAWAKQNGDGFFVGKGSALKRLTFTMPALLQCVREHSTPTLIDVGAAMHGQSGIDAVLEKVDFVRRRGRPVFHPDDSDALLLLSVFGERAHVHAFEPNAKAAWALGAAARRRFATRNFTHRLNVHEMGVGDEWMQRNATACGRLNRFTVRTDYGVGSGFGASTCTRVNVTTLDTFNGAIQRQAARQQQERDNLLYLKVDVEGGEWAVLDGAHKLLHSQGVRASRQPNRKPLRAPVPTHGTHVVILTRTPRSLLLVNRSSLLRSR